MKIRVAILSMLLLTACDDERNHLPQPLESDLVKLEAKLARHRCVGDLNLWERTYRFKRNPGMLASESTDFSVIEFHFRKAGTITLVPGHKVVNPDDSESWPDSPAVEAVSGIYRIRTGTLNVERCRPIARPASG